MQLLDTVEGTAALILHLGGSITKKQFSRHGCLSFKAPLATNAPTSGHAVPSESVASYSGGVASAQDAQLGELLVTA